MKARVSNEGKSVDVGREVHSTAAAELICFGPQLNLIAISYANGDVACCKSGMKRAWRRPVDAAGVRVSAFAWSSDGSVLATAYSDSKVYWLCSATGQSLTIEPFTLPVTTDITNICSLFSSDLNIWFLFTTKLQALIYGNQSSLLGSIALTKSNECELLGASVSDPCTVHAWSRDKNSLRLVTLDLKDQVDSGEVKNILELNDLCSKWLEGMNSSMKVMSESWQDVLAELDQKFVRLAKEKSMDGSEETIGDDMLNLLAVGVTSSALEMFLLHELGERGVKTVAKNLSSVYAKVKFEAGRTMVNLSTEFIQALSRLRQHLEQDRLGALVLSRVMQTTQVIECTRAAASLRSKTFEMADRIDKSLKDTGMFLSWLATSIFKLSNPENQLPGDTGALLPEFKYVESENMDDLVSLITENFCQPWTGEGGIVKFEVVGQYLKDEELKSRAPDSEWEKFLENSPSLKSMMKSTTVLSARNPATSLLQEFNEFSAMLKDLMKNLELWISQPSALALCCKAIDLNSGFPLESCEICVSPLQSDASIVCQWAPNHRALRVLSVDAEANVEVLGDFEADREVISMGSAKLESAVVFGALCASRPTRQHCMDLFLVRVVSGRSATDDIEERCQTLTLTLPVVDAIEVQFGSEHNHTLPGFLVLSGRNRSRLFNVDLQCFKQ